MIKYIFAMDQNRTIGKNNRLSWRLPADLAYFKKTTMHHPVVMGRKTFESLKKPLPGRENIILSRDTTYVAEGCEVVHSKQELIDMAEVQDVFVIGGAEIYALFMPDVGRMHITRIEAQFDGDAYFPHYDESQWELVSKEVGVRDDQNDYVYTFEVYDRILP